MRSTSPEAGVGSPARPPLGLARSGLAVVVGATGGVGGALAERLRGDLGERLITFSRTGDPPLDLTREETVEAAAAEIARRAKEAGEPLRLIVNAAGFLHRLGFAPEKTWQALDPTHLAHAFAVNATGPALLMKHLLPLLARDGRSVFATLSARVGSIADNRLGGWYAYRASKAALNQLVRTAAVELARRWPEAVCVALHPGTVDTCLTQPFARSGLDVQRPAEAAARLLAVIDRLTPADSGGFFDHRGDPVPW